MGKPHKITPAIICLSILPFLLASCHGRKLLEKTTKIGEERDIIPVKVVRVSTREVPLIVHAPAVTIPFESIEIKHVGKAKITEIPVEEGQGVSPGDVLARYDDEGMRLRLELARAQLREAELAIENVNVTSQNREQSTEDENVVPQQEFDTTEAKTNLYEATIERAKAEIAWLEHSAQYTTITSPIAGIVAEKRLTAGALPQEGDVIVKVVRIDPIKVQIDLMQNYLSSITSDTRTTVVFDAISNRVFPVEITLIGPELDEKGGSFIVRGTISNDMKFLKPGLRGEATLKTNYRTTAFLIPKSAIFTEGDREYVYRIVNNTAEKTKITRGEPVDGMPNIIKGVKPGDFVANSAFRKLYDGTLVKMELSK